MGKAAARKGDKIKAEDTHAFVIGNSLSSGKFAFNGSLSDGLSANVRINGRFAATVGSGADNDPKHAPPEGGSFVNPPSNRGAVAGGSVSVQINGRAAARHGDRATTCTEPPPPGKGLVEVVNAAATTVFIGG